MTNGIDPPGVRPVEMFFDEFLREHLLHPHMHPGSKLVIGYHRLDDHEGCFGEEGMCFWSSLLWCGDAVYRIGEYDRECNSWWARWPD